MNSSQAHRNLKMSSTANGGLPVSSIVVASKSTASANPGSTAYYGFPATSNDAAFHSGSTSTSSSGRVGRSTEPLEPPSSPSTFIPIGSSTAFQEAYGGIKNMNAIVKYLLKRDGWAPWTEFASDFQIGQDFSSSEKMASPPIKT